MNIGVKGNTLLESQTCGEVRKLVSQLLDSDKQAVKKFDKLPPNASQAIVTGFGCKLLDDKTKLLQKFFKSC